MQLQAVARGQGGGVASRELAAEQARPTLAQQLGRALGRLTAGSPPASVSKRSRSAASNTSRHG